MQSSGIYNFFDNILHDAFNADLDFALFLLLVIATSIVLDAVTMYTRKNKEVVGLENEKSRREYGPVTSILGKKYVSDIQGLAGTPDAIIIENGYFIPVERKPLANKIRDRYVAQLLVYLRLVEEFEGKRPPYGYLILGKNCRRVKIENTPEKQAWLQSILDEMQANLKGDQAVIPAPHMKKCSHCPVRDECAHSLERRIQSALKISQEGAD